MQWFRMYAETLHDPKVQNLPSDMFKFWVNILCIACTNDGRLPSVKDLAFALRLPELSTGEALIYLLKANLLHEGKNQHGLWYYVHSWEKRQYKSDSSTERVKRFRNVAVTPPDTEQRQNRTEGEKAPKIKILDKAVYISLSRKKSETRSNAEDAYMRDYEQQAIKGELP